MTSRCFFLQWQIYGPVSVVRHVKYAVCEFHIAISMLIHPNSRKQSTVPLIRDSWHKLTNIADILFKTLDTSVFTSHFRLLNLFLSHIKAEKRLNSNANSQTKFNMKYFIHFLFSYFFVVVVYIVEKKT